MEKGEIKKVWDAFVMKTQTDKKSKKIPVNFLGSVTHHEKLFMDAFDEVLKG